MTPRQLPSRLAWVVSVLITTFACTAPEQPALQFHQVPATAIVTRYPELDFTHIREVVETADAIWVLDMSPPFVTRIERSSGSVRRGGRRGEGPAEFSFPVALQVDPGDGTAHVWDLGIRRHTVLDSELSVLVSQPLNPGALPGGQRILEISYAYPYRVRRTGDGVLASDFPTRLDRATDLVRGSVVRATPTLAPEREVVRFAEHLTQGGGDPRQFIALPRWDACGSDLVVWRPNSHELAWLDNDGGVKTSVRLSGRPSSISHADIAVYLEEMARVELGPDYANAGIDFMAMAREARPLFSDHLPFATEVVCVEGGPAWLRLFDNRTDPLGRGRRWLRVSRSGAIEPIEFPASFQPVAVALWGLLGSYESPDGLRWLAEWME